MAKQATLNVLETIEKIYQLSKDCKLESQFFVKVKPELQILSDYFKITPTQSLLVAMVLFLNLESEEAGFSSLSSHFNCNRFKLLEFRDDFEKLFLMDILTKNRMLENISYNLTNSYFLVNEKITEAILRNEPMPIVAKKEYKDVIELLEAIYNLGQQVILKTLSFPTLLTKTKKLVSTNLHFPLIRLIKEYRLSPSDTFMFLHVIWGTLIGEGSVRLMDIAEILTTSPSLKFYFINKIITGENKLIRQNHLKIEGNFFEHSYLKLSDASFSAIEEIGIKLFVNRINRQGIIQPQDIYAKTLYFNELEQKQVDIIKTMIYENQFKKTQSCLQSKGFPPGVTILLHGLPGTGKTETVYQIAKDTHREIVKVDISNSKSAWFGESEKTIKNIFSNYKDYAKQSKRTPILLFNEADAILSKRKDSFISSVAQTENTIQNIILEELENFEGIFFATTNLVKNLDSAFERRFLFKIEFQKPHISEKTKIWKSKLPMLSDIECETLATRFDFTGGQIDNIVKKTAIHEIIHGNSIDFEAIMDFCKSELLLPENSKNMGFKYN